MKRSSAGFDRVRPRAPATGRRAEADPRTAPPSPGSPDDGFGGAGRGGARQGSAVESPLAQGRRALFSVAAPDGAPPRGLTIECSRCGKRSPLGLRAALRAGLPSLHLPLLGGVLGRRYSSWVRCPSCGRRTWARVEVRV